jgi:hypothetical protein
MKGSSLHEEPSLSPHHVKENPSSSPGIQGDLAPASHQVYSPPSEPALASSYQLYAHNCLTTCLSCLPTTHGHPQVLPLFSEFRRKLFIETLRLLNLYLSYGTYQIAFQLPICP